MPKQQQQQHVDLYRKSLLRRSLLHSAAPGPAYVPFIGDGDLALLHYAKDRGIWGADLDEARIATCKERLQATTGHHTVIKANCDGWPFPDTIEPFAVADFDAYSDPYASFRAFWDKAPKASPLVLFFTDGHRQGIIRAGVLHHPSGIKEPLPILRSRRAAFNFYWQRIIRPWFREYVAPWRVMRTKFYTRGSSMLYWGAVVRREVENTHAEPGAEGGLSQATR